MAQTIDITAVEDATVFYPLHIEYAFEKSKLSTCNNVEPKSGQIEGIEHAEWTLKMAKYPGTSSWSIHLEVKTKIPLKCAVSLEISSESDLHSQTFHDVVEGMKNIGANELLKYDHVINKFRNDKLLIVRVNALFSYKTTEEQRVFGTPAKMIQSKDWSQRLQNHGEKDFKLIVGDESVEIHKFFLVLESTVFARMLQEKKYKETQTGEMTITDFKFNTVKAVVAFCYGEDIADFIKFTENAIELLMFVDKYDMTNLKATFEEYYSKKLTKGNVANIFSAASKVNANLLKAKCVNFIQSLPEIEKASIVHGAIDEELRELFSDEN